MSTGALTQLAALGSQDQYLSVQGEVTFWKGVYRRHTNFAKETVMMMFNQTPAWGQNCSATLQRTGDLLSKTWLQVELPALNKTITNADDMAAVGYTEERDRVTTKLINDGYFPRARYCDEVGHAIIDKVDLIIGGTTIDSHPGHYLQVWNELTTTEEKRKLNHLIGKSASDEELEDWAKDKQTLYIPLQFFFCRHLMQALPLIALQYHEVKIDVKFKTLSDVVAHQGEMPTGPDGTTPVALSTFVDIGDLPARQSGVNLKQIDFPLGTVRLVCNMVYLEEEERRTFAASTHEYLVDLLQFQGEIEASSGTSTTYHAFFNHPTTELIFVFVPNASIEASEPFQYGALNKSYNAFGDCLKTAKLQFNGYDRFSAMPADYFRSIVPAQYHTAVPDKQVYNFSFSLEPEDFRPSGSVNLSRIDNVKLILEHVEFDSVTHGTKTAKGAKIRVYARSKNVLRIKSGMAGLAYAN